MLRVTLHSRLADLVVLADSDVVAVLLLRLSLMILLRSCVKRL